MKAEPLRKLPTRPLPFAVQRPDRRWLLGRTPTGEPLFTDRDEPGLARRFDNPTSAEVAARWAGAGSVVVDLLNPDAPPRRPEDR